MNDWEKASLICSIFSALDEINSGWDAKEVWNNLKQKSTAEVRAIYEQVISERKKTSRKMSCPLREIQYKYKGYVYTIELWPSGWWSCFVLGFGYIRRDTLTGVKSEVRRLARNGSF